MTGVRNAHADPAESSGGLASWYVPGRADGFGDRLLMFDNTDTPSLELLRFRHELAAAPGFEDLLRERVRRLSAFRHPAFSSVRAVQHLEGGEGLTLVSVHAPGQRLSELFDQHPRKPLHPGIVTWLLRELTPALAALQAEGDDVSHGAVTADRIVLTPEGRLCLVEHVLGSALQQLQLSPARLWREFGVVALPKDAAASRLDARGDVVQLAGVALSMLLARPVTLHDLQHRLPALLDEFSERTTPGSVHHVAPLRFWLERALQANTPVYGSASDAEEDLRELPPHNKIAFAASPQQALAGVNDWGVERPGPGGDQSDHNGSARAYIRPVPRPDESRDPLVPSDDVIEVASFPSEALSEALPGTAEASLLPVTAAQPAPLGAAARPRATGVPAPVARDHGEWGSDPGELIDKKPHQRPEVRRDTRPRQFSRTVVAALGAIIVVEAAVIALLTTRGLTPGVATPVVIESTQPGSTVFVNGEPAGATPLQLNVGSEIRSVRVVGAVAASGSAGTSGAGTAVAPSPASPGRRADDARDDAIVATSGSARQGGLRLVSPIDLTVLQGDRVLGSTDGPVFVAAGTYEVDLVNSALGYKVHQTITVKPGQIGTLTVTVPNGRLSFNAQPGWAEVLIDQKLVGETPLANISVAPGQHDVVFRHPKLGEQRQTVLVRPDTLTRVTATFEP